MDLCSSQPLQEPASTSRMARPAAQAVGGCGSTRRAQFRQGGFKGAGWKGQRRPPTHFGNSSLVNDGRQRRGLSTSS